MPRQFSGLESSSHPPPLTPAVSPLYQGIIGFPIMYAHRFLTVSLLVFLVTACSSQAVSQLPLFPTVTFSPNGTTQVSHNLPTSEMSSTFEPAPTNTALPSPTFIPTKMQSLVPGTATSTPGPDSVVIWCPDCANNGKQLYLAIVEDKWNPFWTQEVFHGDVCDKIQDYMVHKMYWYEVDDFPNVSNLNMDASGRRYLILYDVPVALVNCPSSNAYGFIPKKFLQQGVETVTQSP
jgi:hypothetical protein